MPKHHSEDYKITAVKHYINKSKNLSKTCKIFECSRISLKDGLIDIKKINQLKDIAENQYHIKLLMNRLNTH